MAEPAQKLPAGEPPKFTPEEIEKLKVRVEAALDKIRPAIQMDGGDADLLDLTPEGVVVVQLRGHCETCSLSPMTMKLGVERLIREEVPEITAVESV
jgi:Fe-S cluster biogenesis protein NfuA